MKIKATIEVESNFSKKELSELRKNFPDGLPDKEIQLIIREITDEFQGIFSEEDVVKVELELED